MKAYYDQLVNSGWAFETPPGSPIHALAVERSKAKGPAGAVFIDVHKGEVNLLSPEGDEVVWSQEFSKFCGPQRKEIQRQEKAERKGRAKNERASRKAAKQDKRARRQGEIRKGWRSQLGHNPTKSRRGVKHSPGSMSGLKSRG
jgi:hypothetical protein